MKKLFYLVALVSVTASCRKDKCESCPPNATCVNGGCECNTPWYGSNCDLYDSCYNIICLNGGTCINGHCECLAGFSGDDCGSINTPTSMVVTKIYVVDFPATNYGVPWDPHDGPDVKMSINAGLQAKLEEFVSGTILNSYAPLTFDSLLGLPDTIANLSSRYTVGAWEVDGNFSKPMNARTFSPLDFESGFPSTIYLTGEGWYCYLYIEWKF